MSQPTPGAGATRAPIPPPDPGKASTAQLLGDLSDQVTRLVRDKVRPAQATIESVKTDVATVKTRAFR